MRVRCVKMMRESTGSSYKKRKSFLGEFCGGLLKRSSLLSAVSLPFHLSRGSRFHHLQMSLYINQTNRRQERAALLTAEEEPLLQLHKRVWSEERPE